MDAIREKNDYDDLRSGLSDEKMNQQLSQGIDVLVSGVSRRMSLTSYFCVRKDFKLNVMLPNGQKPLDDPRNSEKPSTHLKK